MDNIEKPFSGREKILLRCFLILCAFALAAMTAVEVGIAFHLHFARTFVRVGMWAGSATWILLAFVAWRNYPIGKYRNARDPLWARIAVASVMTAFAICTQASIHWGILTSISLWANVAASVLMLAVMTFWVIPKFWNPEPVSEMPDSVT